MRKIYRSADDVVSVAWIGQSAPIPAGWFLDINSAKEADNGVQTEKGQGNKTEVIRAEALEEPQQEPAMPKRRGRPKVKGAA
jgi:hypothetical protein